MSKPTVIHDTAKIQQIRKQWKNKTCGFVPTMGALHTGHADLLKKARAENDILVLSIFVNPTQFNDKKDFEKYPITWEKDLTMAEQCGVDYVFAPAYEDMYPDQFKYQISENSFSKLLCGTDRPGHFEGVLSVVMKLFQLVQPQHAYFGEKDFQQLRLIKGMVQAFFLPIEIVPVQTVRESDGLAMSSRNVRLTEQERKMAPEIYKTILKSSSANEAKTILSKLGFDVDYVSDIDDRRFVAAKLGQVRLIDNVRISRTGK